MERGRFLRLTRTTMAIAQRDSSNVAIIVPEGASIEVLGPFDGVHLTDVRYEGEIIMMFTDAMEAHTEVIKTKTAGTS
jgi:hypothetical protein